MVVDAVVDEGQWAARVTVARSFAASGIDANVSVGDGGTVGIGAFGVGDAWDIDFTQDGGDTGSIIRGFAPSADVEHITNMVALGGGGHADWLDFRCEFNGVGQSDEGNIVDDTDGSPVGVNGVLGGPDFNASGLISSIQTNVVGTQQNVEEDGIISAMGSGKNPLVGNQRTSAKVLTIDENSHLPWGRVGNGLSSADDTGSIVHLSAESAGIDSGGALREDFSCGGL